MVFETAESISRSVDLNDFKSILGLGMNTDFEPIGKRFYVLSKNFSDESFGLIPIYCITKSSGCNNTQLRNLRVLIIEGDL